MSIADCAAGITKKSFKLQQSQSSSTSLNCSMWNVTSMVNKTPDIMEHLLDRDPSLVFIQETWLKSNRSSVTSLIKDYGYTLLHNIRKNRKKVIGGGVGVLVKWGMKYKTIKNKEFSSFEHIIIRIPVTVRTSLLVISIYKLFVSVTVRTSLIVISTYRVLFVSVTVRTSLLVISIYRVLFVSVTVRTSLLVISIYRVLFVSVTVRTSLLVISIYRVLFVSVTVFLEEIVTLFETLVTLKDNLILAGDINIHMDEDTIYAKSFKDILDTFNMIHHIEFPTHKQGHTLDVIITFKDSPIISKIAANEFDVSHHFLVDFRVDVTTEIKLEKEIHYRKLKDIDADKFCEDIANSFSITDKPFGEVITSYNEVMGKIIDEHAPVINKTTKIVPSVPWFDSEYVDLRKQRRRAEKVYKKTNLPADKNKYIDLRKKTTELARANKCKYYGNKLEGNNKILFSSLNKLLDNEKEVVLPDAESDSALANSFLQYFTEKIEEIRSSFPTHSDVDVDMPRPARKLFEFERTNEDEVRQIVLTFGTKCSPDDPLPSAVLKSMIEVYSYMEEIG